MRSQSWFALLLIAGVAACKDGSGPAKRRSTATPPAVMVAADRVSSRVDDETLRARVAGARTLAEALEWTVPRMGDDFRADRMYAARDVPRIGGELFARWADAHLRWEDVSAARPIDVTLAVREAAPFRGLPVCLRGSFAAPDPSRPRDVTFVASDAEVLLLHDVHLVSDVPARHAGVKLCAVVIGRRIVSSREHPGLLLVGIARDEPPLEEERPLDEAFDELFADEPDRPGVSL